ncbi:MAG: YlxR family protein [Chloroflexi bacterium]|nr:YlxR family protein [Chloroflexota bacterium]MCI0790761.1 YlxR family protein [Chloroflexota bacterium]MCI0868612.1 YlxR family protein [Chloroflexota bacterium]MCI0886630.1 YlxR family protein [Chloroflexota bacterium]
MATRTRHDPQRSCVICGRKTSKRELTRLCANPDGSVTVDPTGKSPGRGAYVCSEGQCAGKGLNRGRLEHVLRTKLDEDNWERILSEVSAPTDLKC